MDENKKHKVAKESMEDESDFSGSAPDPETVQEKDTLEREHEMGFYTENDEEHPDELDAVEEAEELEK